MLRPSSYLSLLLVTQAVLGQRFGEITPGDTEECGPCDVSSCTEAIGCYAGLVQDWCGCCKICGKAEGESCDLGDDAYLYDSCGENLDCLPRNKYEDEEEDGGVCVCREKEMACGSDNVTYGNLCQMLETAYRNGTDTAPEVVSWGPCESEPVIVSPPMDTHEPYGSNLVLDCETKGFPVPTIRWEVIRDDGSLVQLPSDDEFVAVQVRGGPERLMTTGWVQIIDLRPFDAGSYVCVAANTHGEARAKATVGVYKPSLNSTSDGIEY